jgi:hypothetical protein
MDSTGLSLRISLGRDINAIFQSILLCECIDNQAQLQSWRPGIMRGGDGGVQPDSPVIFVGVRRKAHKECAYGFFTILDNHQDETL